MVARGPIVDGPRDGAMAVDEPPDQSEMTAPVVSAEAPDAHFRVLASGVLAFRLPDSKAGKPVWLDVVRRLKVCEHGHSMHEMHHWNCAARPRAKPTWVDCQCGTKGLFTDTKAKPVLPTDVVVPSYASVLWRDGTPKRLQPTNVLAVRVPGKPKEREVWIDEEGRARCEHGCTESGITRTLRQRKERSASLLQQWWRQLDHEARAGVRRVLLHTVPSKASEASEGSEASKAAASVWRRLSEERRQQEAYGTKKRKRGPAAMEWCGCRPGGLRREIFGTTQRGEKRGASSVRTAGAPPRGPRRSCVYA